MPLNFGKNSHDQARILSSSVVGALGRIHGIHVHEIVETSSEYDLRQALGVSLSRELPQSLPFRRLLCLDLSRRNSNTEEALENVFASLALFEAKGIATQTISLPVLGTGGMGYSPQRILKALIPKAKQYMEQSLTLKRIAFFGYRSEMADLLDESMNQILGRSRVTLQKKALITGMCKDIVAEFQSSRQLVDDRHRPLLKECESVLSRDVVQSFEVGILGRRVAEMIALDLLGGTAGSVPLARNIDKLRSIGIAEWIISYFNVLRLLGNESAHEANAGQSIPPFVSPQGDLAVGLSCVLRLWEFWVDWKTNHHGKEKASQGG